MNIREIREKTLKALFKDLRQSYKDLTLLDMSIKLGKSKDLKQKRVLKKQVARIKTVISEKGILNQNEKA